MFRWLGHLPVWCSFFLHCGDAAFVRTLSSTCATSAPTRSTIPRVVLCVKTLSLIKILTRYGRMYARFCVHMLLFSLMHGFAGLVCMFECVAWCCRWCMLATTLCATRAMLPRSIRSKCLPGRYRMDTVPCSGVCVGVVWRAPVRVCVTVGLTFVFGIV
jgi:hypothetical protein